MFPILIPASCAKRVCALLSSRPQTRPRNVLCRPGRRTPARASRRAYSDVDCRAHIAAYQRIPQWSPDVGGRVNPSGSRFPWQSAARGIRPPQRQMPESRSKQQATSDFSWLKLQNKFPAIFAPGIVVERPKASAFLDGLHVARIEMIEKVEGPKTDSGFESPVAARRDRHRARDLQVKG